MKSTTCYVTVRVEIDYKESSFQNEEEAIQQAIADCDYKFSLEQEDLKITGTEICGINE